MAEIVFMRPLVAGFIPSNAGSGPVVPSSLAITSATSTNISTIPVPEGKDVTLYLTAPGGGGGGGSDPSGAGGGGAGGGSFAVVVIPAAKWALGGTLVTGAVGAGGASFGDDGSDGSDSILTIDGDQLLVCGAGNKGLSDGTAGAGGTAVVDEALTSLATADGADGTAGGATDGGAGGKGAGPGAGAGGAGGTSGHHAGFAGSTRGGGGGGGHTGDGAGGAGALGWALLNW